MGTAEERVGLPRPGAVEGLALAALLVAQAVCLWAWLRADAVPNGFQNEFHHLLSAQLAWSHLVEGRWGALLAMLFTDYYPPLMNLMGIAALVLGRGAEDWLACTNLLWCALLLLSLWGLGRRLIGPGAGLAAAALVSVLPAIAGNARYFEPNLALPALCTATVLAVACAGEEPRRWLGAGVLAAGALLADRLTAAPCLVGIGAAVLGPIVLGRQTAARRARALRCLGAFVVPAVALVGPWLISWAIRYLPEIAAQMGGEITAQGVQTEHRSLLDPLTWLYYPLTFADAQAGLVVGALAAAGGAGFVATARGQTARAVQGALVGMLLVLSLILKKQAYYSQPIVPLGALMTVWLLWKVRPAPLRIAALSLVTLCALQVTVEGSTGWRPFRDALFWTRVEEPIPPTWVEPRYPQLDQPDRLPHVADDVADWLLANGWSEEDEVALYAESQVLYEFAFMTMLRLRLRTDRVDGASTAPNRFHERLPGARWFVYAANEAGRAWPDPNTVEAMMIQQQLVNEWLDSLQADLAALPPRATLRGSWSQTEDEGVHIYELD